MNTFYRESWFYHTNRAFPDPIDEYESRAVDADAIAYKHFFWEKGCGELFRVSDTLLAFFNFCDSRIELLDETGQQKGMTTIDFHIKKSERFIASLAGSLTGSSEFNWNKTLVQDAVTHKIYAVFTNNGFIHLKCVDPLTGSLSSGVELPYEFPEKTKIFKGEVYFLFRGAGANGNRKLYKMLLK